MEIVTGNNREGVNRRTEVLLDKDFRRLSGLIQSNFGIKMPNPKKIMLEARLKKRLQALGMKSFRAYCDYLFSPDGMKQELTPMIDVITTNKTDFFREPRHFVYLTDTVLPELIESKGTGIRRPLAVWSAGCATGEEPYSLAMVLNEFGTKTAGFRFTVLGTDVSTKVLTHAIRGVYGRDRIAAVPARLIKKYLMESRDSQRHLVRIVPELRTAVRFRRLNFMDGDFGMREPVDVIFCRNVIIYFEKPAQERLLKQLCRNLVPGGYIFMGHSETLHGLNVPLVSVGPMVYRKRP